ncbi:MAG: hypothetical protein BMS9Abin25_1409 [Gammaproteobacteria bacterium]|nr:MAG: hypothetical protein BMS9Abin25_1409 [Gammaproteobacteria bacterium]
MPSIVVFHEPLSALSRCPVDALVTRTGCLWPGVAFLQSRQMHVLAAPVMVPALQAVAGAARRRVPAPPRRGGSGILFGVRKTTY